MGLKSFLRRWLQVEPPPISVPAATPVRWQSDRPILVDESDGICQTCEAWRACGPFSRDGRLVCNCHRCGAEIKRYQNMNGDGFSAVRPHHWHIRPVGAMEGGGGAVAGREGMYETLCFDCYLQDFRECYPDEEFPQMPAELVSLTPAQAKEQALLDRPIVGEVTES